MWAEIMKVSVNEQSLEVPTGCHIEQLLTMIERPLNGTAVAVNQTIVHRQSWAETVLNEGDQISLFQAIAGG